MSSKSHPEGMKQRLAKENRRQGGFIPPRGQRLRKAGRRRRGRCRGSAETTDPLGPLGVRSSGNSRQMPPSPTIIREVVQGSRGTGECALWPWCGQPQANRSRSRTETRICTRALRYRPGRFGRAGSRCGTCPLRLFGQQLATPLPIPLKGDFCDAQLNGPQRPPTRRPGARQSARSPVARGRDFAVALRLPAVVAMVPRAEARRSPRRPRALGPDAFRSMPVPRPLFDFVRLGCTVRDLQASRRAAVVETGSCAVGGSRSPWTAEGSVGSRSASAPVSPPLELEKNAAEVVLRPQDSGFSVRVFAARAGVQNSRAPVCHVRTANSLSQQSRSLCFWVWKITYSHFLKMVSINSSSVSNFQRVSGSGFPLNLAFLPSRRPPPQIVWGRRLGERLRPVWSPWAPCEAAETTESKESPSHPRGHHL